MESESIAILQNQFRLSGRTRVICEIIDMLNEQGITPDILTFTPRGIGSQIPTSLGYRQLRFNYRQIAPIPSRRGWLWQIVLINQLTWRKQASYRLVFNSNNTLHGLNPNGTYLHYIYYPIAITTEELKRFSEYVSTPWRWLYGKLWAQILRLWQPVSTANLYAISEFSRDAVTRAYPQASMVGIIYPPSFSDQFNPNSDRALSCVSTGSFTHDKRQLDQLMIAKQLPDIEFHIVGSVKSESYYRACQNYIDQEKLPNVSLHPDLPYDELQTLLNKSKYFLHTKHSEHFGIGTVEAIAAGCIPIVHDSGGQKEVVPLPELRFSRLCDAVRFLNHSLRKNLQHNATRQTLQQHIARFSRANFRDRMHKAIQQALDTG